MSTNQSETPEKTDMSDFPSYVLVSPAKAEESGVLDAEAVESLRSEYFGNLKLYRESADLREKVNEKFHEVDKSTAERMVEMTYICQVASVDTITEKWETLMMDYIRGEIDRNEFVESTRDGELKSEKIEYVLNSDIPAEVVSALRTLQDPDLSAPFVKEAREWLIGLKTGRPDDTYARATKSAFVTWLLGFDTVCMDRRIHRSLKPIFEACMADYEVKPDDTIKPEGSPHQSRRADMNGRVPSTVEFVHDSLKWNVSEMDSYAEVAIDWIDDTTEIPRDRIPQVAFNAGGDGETTIHRDLMRILAGA